MQTFNSVYLGICVQNNDPEHRGRIKVWVPHVSTTVYNKWNQLKKDVTFSFPGSPGGEDISAVLGDLKDTLPWAEMCASIAGASTAGYYNAFTDTNSVSDAPILFGQPGTNYTATSSATQIDPENKGGKPGVIYENDPVSDAFGNTAKINSQHLNQYSNNYKPSTYSNSAKGLFSVPNVGAHIWVFFREGIPHYPVYMGTSFGQEDFNSIFQSGDGSYPDYPGTYENKDQRLIKSPDENTATYRNKLVINQRGAAIEIINTTDRESYKVTHFQGGYYELNNKFTSLFNPKNFQLLTLADKFETVNGHNNTYTGRDRDDIIRGDHWLKVGNFNIDAMSKWSSLYSKLTGATPAATMSDLTKDLATQEKQMGFGGNSFEFITKHKLITVGLQLNTAPSYMFVPASLVGGTEIVTSIVPNIAGGYFEPLPAAIPTFKELYVPDMPGGNLDIFAMNRFNVKTGAGGATLQSSGNVKVQGGVVDVRGDMINLGSKDGQIDINGSLVTISADILYLKNKVGSQVMVDSNLGVNGNVVIGGGAYVEGELFVNHVTAPIEYQVTENTQIVAAGPLINPTGTPGAPSSGWAVVGTDIVGGLVVTIPPLVVTAGVTQATTVMLSVMGGSIINLNSAGTGELIIAQPHSHVFKNIPLTLHNGSVVGPSDFNNAAANTIGDPKAKPIASEPRVDGRIQTVGVPPPSLYAVGLDGSPVNYPNGPGSNIAGPKVVPGT